MFQKKLAQMGGVIGMHVDIIRYRSSDRSTFGKLYIDGIYQCYTLEDAYRAQKVDGETRIPSGTYVLDLRVSPRFTPKYGHKMIWVKDVPNFEYILIHCGNTVKDTEGCILVGEAIIESNGVLLNSRSAYNNFYPLIANAINSGKKASITLIDFS